MDIDRTAEHPSRSESNTRLDHPIDDAPATQDSSCDSQDEQNYEEPATCQRNDCRENLERLLALQTELKNQKEQLDGLKNTVKELGDEKREVLEKLREAKNQLEEYVLHRNEMEGRLKTASDTEQDLQKSLAQAKNDAADATTRMRKLASQLNKYRSQDQYKVTDEFLINQYKILVFNIRDWAATYFHGSVGDESQAGPRYAERNSSTKFTTKYLKPITSQVREFLMSPTRCPLIVEAFIWKVLHGEVFGRNLWSGQAREVLEKLEIYLAPAEEVNADRQYRSWRASTSRLLLDVFGEPVRKELEELLRNIWDVLSPWRRSDREGYHRGLEKIVSDAIALDKEISKQLADVHCLYPSDSSLRDDPQAMEAVDASAIGKEEPTHFHFVVSPGLEKYGNALGEHYDQSIHLVPMRVVLTRFRQY